MNHGFLDEAGDVGLTSGATSTVIVVVVVVAHPERVRKAVTKTRKSLGRSLRLLPELKASALDPRLTSKLLTHAVKIGFDAVAVVIDKRIVPIPEDPEDLYRRACVRAVQEVLTRFGPLTLTIDRRYTTEKLRIRLNRMIETGIEGTTQLLSITHVESQQERVLQIADAIAWSLLQKYERGDVTFWEIIQECVVEIKLS